MKDFFTYIKILCLTLSIALGIQVQAQTNYPYLQSSGQSLGTLTAINGGSFTTESGDPNGEICHKLFKHIRNDQINATFGVALEGNIDLSSSQEVVLNMLVSPPTEEALAATTLMCALRNNGDEATQVTATTEITQVNEWVDYIFDFSEVDPSAEFNQVIFYLIPDTQNKEADKVEFYINEVKGPKVKQDFISTTAKTSLEGNIVTIDFNGHEAIDQFFNPLFKVFNEAQQELAVNQTLINGTSIDLYLESPIMYGELITYSFESGTITNASGIALAPFEGKEVLNNSNKVTSLYTLYQFGENSLLTLPDPRNYTLDKNAVNPNDPEDQVGKFVRAQSHWVNLEWNLPTTYAFDFSETKTFSFDLYLEDVGIEQMNKNITLGFRRYDENGDLIDEFREVNRTVTCFGQWATYTFDLSENTTEYLSSIKDVMIYLAPADVEYKATGMTGYVDNLRGPKIIADQILTTVATDNEAKNIYLDIQSFGELQLVETTGFTVKVEGVEQTIANVSNTAKQIIIEMNTALDLSKSVTLSYDDTQATIEDEDGLTLVSFTDENVELPSIDVELPDFENGVTYYFDGTDNPNISIAPRTNTLEVVDNPFITAEVTEAKVTKLTRANAHRGISAFSLNGDKSVLYGDRNLKFKFKVYQVATTPMVTQNVLQLRLFGNNGEWTTIRLKLDETNVDQWVEYSFDFTAKEFNDSPNTQKIIDTSYNRFELTFGEDIPPGGGAGPVDEAIYYITNLEGPEAVADTDASLLALLSDDKLVEGFTADMTEVEIMVPFGTTVAPKITAIANHDASVLSINQADLTTETTTVTVTAADAITTETYNVTYKELAPSTVTSIEGIKVNGYPLTNFDPAQKEYTLTYLFGTDVVPTVEVDKTDPNSTVVITPPVALPGDMKIEITAQDGTTKEVYNLKLDWSTPSNIATLSTLDAEGLITDFDKEQLSYTVNLPFGSVIIPQVSAEKEDESATMMTTQATELPGEAKVVVTAQDGTEVTYTVQFVIDPPSTDASFKSITINGLEFTEYVEGEENYTIGLRFGTVDVPTIEVVKSSDLAELNITHATDLTDVTTIEIIAQDGIAKTVINFSFEILPKQSEDGSLRSIALNGVELENFDPEVFSYDVVLELGTTEVPEFTAEVNDSKATMIIEKATSVYGKTIIRVQPEDPYAPESVYTVHLTVRLPSTNTNLASVMIDGTPLEVFKTDSTDYILEGYAEAPVVEVTLEDERSNLNVLQASRLGAPAIITVTAEDGISEEIYTFLFARTETPTAVVPAIFSDISLRRIANHSLQISSEKFLSDCTLMINDIQGKVIYGGKMNGYQKTINQLPDTILIIRIINNEGQWFKKIKL
ncbi:hypothetical protein [Flammeovirga sp. OC4]|uniref:hypothetical protein n=1 Tax=Flammeovirga sp. OC4 TaxID=1382345 RepID=UPI0012E09263|nr:hypothetical protein [Flammeovirga sp. OC4]